MVLIDIMLTTIKVNVAAIVPMIQYRTTTVIRTSSVESFIAKTGVVNVPNHINNVLFNIQTT